MQNNASFFICTHYVISLSKPHTATFEYYVQNSLAICKRKEIGTGYQHHLPDQYGSHYVLHGCYGRAILSI